jgi:hypothetical protein
LPTLSRKARGADSTKESNAMTRDITPAGSPATGAVDEAFAEVRASFDWFCLAAGDRGARHDHGGGCRGGLRAAPRSRCGAAGAPLGPDAGTDRFPRRQDRGRASAGPGHGRPRSPIPSWETAAEEDWLGCWAMNLMLINVSTRRFADADTALLSPSSASASPHADGRSCTPRQPAGRAISATPRMGTPDAVDPRQIGSSKGTWQFFFLRVFVLHSRDIRLELFRF